MSEGFDEKRYGGARSGSFWSGGSGSCGSFEGRGGRWTSSGSGSDALTWRKGGQGKEKSENVKVPDETDGGKDIAKETAKGADVVLVPSSLVEPKGAGRGAGGKERKYKHVQRDHIRSEQGARHEKVSGKRRQEQEDEQQEKGAKKLKMVGVEMVNKDDVKELAGPADRSCDHQ